jgi:hypothetical protein
LRFQISKEPTPTVVRIQLRTRRNLRFERELQMQLQRELQNEEGIAK